MFLVLEYLRGRDLREILRRSTELGLIIPQALAAWIGAETCAGLDFAHEATAADGQKLNLVHRDVSPKNIRITDGGVVKVIDFGIARVEVRLSETAPGSVKGTLGFMSPEQVMGAEIDRRSDIFSFGICLFQMLTDRNPFEAATLKDRIQKLIHAPVPSPREFNPDVDPRLEAVTLKCLERDPEQRYARMRDVQHELEAFVADQKIVSPRQRLVTFLEGIFPDIHELPPKLQEVLATASGLTQRPARTSNPVAVPIAISIPPPGGAVAEQSLGGWSAWAEPPPSDLQWGKRSAPQTNSTISQAITEAGGTRRPIPLPLLFGAAAIGAIALGLALVSIDKPTSPSGVEALDLPQDVMTAPVVAPPVAPVAQTSTVTAKVKTEVASERVARPNTRVGARELLRAGALLARRGQLDDAVLLYRLAHARSGGDVDPSVYKNLALVHRDLQDVAKVRACFNMYLSRRPDANDAAKIRALLDASPPAKSVPCVSDAEEANAEKVARRVGARIEGWINEAQEPG